MSLALREAVESPGYPFVAGSAPDQFARLLARLIPGWRTEPFDPNPPDLYLATLEPAGSGRSLSITAGFPGPYGYGPHREWHVAGHGSVLSVELELSYAAGQPEFAAALRVLRVLGALPYQQRDFPARIRPGWRPRSAAQRTCQDWR
ncbi:hypothetical protein [Actinoplanes subglobosus]|uniref:Uncharacterized protein n=1 Tax=Actinoplanes subglobosus TaxID=1547892 RepID=A0ABV8IX50_9ACTN